MDYLYPPNVKPLTNEEKERLDKLYKKIKALFKNKDIKIILPNKERL